MTDISHDSTESLDTVDFSSNKFGNLSTELDLLEEFLNFESSLQEKKPSETLEEILHFQGLTSSFLPEGSYKEFETELKDAGKTIGSRREYYEWLADKDPSFAQLLLMFDQMQDSGIDLHEINIIDTDTAKPLDTMTKGLLKSKLVDRTIDQKWPQYENILSTLDIPQKDIIGAEKFIRNLLNPLASSVTLSDGKKISFKKKDLRFQRRGGKTITNLMEYGLSGDGYRPSDMFVPMYTLDAETTDSDLYNILMHGDPNVISSTESGIFSPEQYKYLLFIYFKSTYGDISEITQKILGRMGGYSLNYHDQEMADAKLFELSGDVEQNLHTKDRTSAHVGEPTEEDVKAIMNSWKARNPGATKAEIQAQEELHKTKMVAWLRNGQIRYRKSHIEKFVFEKGVKYWGENIQIDIKSEVDVSGEPKLYLAKKTGKKVGEYFPLEDFWSFAGSGLSKNLNKAMKFEMTEHLKGMYRHEEAHRIFHYFGLDSVELNIDGNSITLSEEELCRIAENNFGFELSSQTDRNIRTFLREDGSEIQIPLDILDTALSAKINTLVTEGVEIPDSLKTLQENNPESRFSLIQYHEGSGDGRHKWIATSTIHDIGLKLQEAYDEDTFSGLSEASTPEQARENIRARRGQIRESLSDAREFVQQEELQLGTLLKESYDGFVKASGKFQEQIIKDPPTPTVPPAPPATPIPTKKDVAFSAFQRHFNEIFDAGKHHDNLVELIGTIDTEITGLEDRYSGSAEYQTLAAPIIQGLRNKKIHLKAQKDELDIMKTTMQEYMDKTNACPAIVPLTVDQLDDLKKSHRKLATYNGISTQLQTDIDETKNILLASDLADDKEDISQEKEIKEVEELKAFAKEFNSLPGDGTVNFDIESGKFSPDDGAGGALIYFRVQESNSGLPGGGNGFIKTKILHTPGAKTFTLELLDGSESDLPNKGKFTYDLKGSSFNDFKNTRGGSSNLFKATQVHSMKDSVGNYLKAGSANNMDGFDTKNLYPSWGSDHVVKDGETRSHFKETRKISDITHLGYRKKSHEYDFYDIDQGGSAVTVSRGDRSKTMDYTTFAIFVQDKGLIPFNNDEYNKASTEVKKAETGAGLKKGGRNWLSPLAARSMLKKLPEGFMSNLKKQQELAQAESEVWLFDKFSFLPGVAKTTADQNLDRLVWSEIEARKNELMGMDPESKDSKGEKKEGISQVVDDFKNPQFGNRKYMRNMAGDFIYMMGLNEIYDGDLGQYASEHKRVEILLGPEKHAEFKAKFDKEYADLRNISREDPVARDNLIKAELKFLEENLNKDEYKRIYGTKFHKEISNFREGLGGLHSKVAQEAANRSFEEVMNAAGSKISKPNSEVFPGFLQVAFQKAETKEQYEAVNLLVIQLYTSGAIHRMTKPATDKLASMGNTYGNSFLKMANDPHSPRRVINILNAVSDNSLSVALGGIDGDYIQMDTFSHNDGHKKRKTQTAKRRASHRTSVLQAINLDSGDLIKAIGGLEDKKGSRTTKDNIVLEDLKHFYDQRIHDVGGAMLGQNERAHQTSPFYGRNILHFPGSTFQSMLLQDYNKNSQQFKSEHTKFLRQSLTGSVRGFDSKISGVQKGIEQEYFLHLVTKKFITFFKDSFGSSEMNAFQYALRTGDGKLAMELIDETSQEKGWDKQPSMRDGMEAFADFFKNNAILIQEYCEDGGGRKMLDAFDGDVNGDSQDGNKRYIEARVRKQVRNKKISDAAKNKNSGNR